MPNDSLVRIFLCGDDVNKKLITLLGKIDNQIPTYSENGIVFAHDKYRYTDTDKYKEYHILRSRCVPCDTILVVPPCDISYSDPRPDSNDSIYIIVGYPYKSKNSRDEAIKCRRSFSYVEVRFLLIYDIDEMRAASDCDNASDALEEARRYYENEGFPVTIVNSHDNVSELFFWKKRRNHDILKYGYKEKIEDAKNNMESIYNNYYSKILYKELENDIIHLRNLEKFTRYDNKLGFAKLKDITKAASAYFFDDKSQLAKGLGDMFEMLTRDICVWDKKIVISHLLEILKQKFIIYINKDLPIVKDEGSDKYKYEMFVKKTDFNVKFVRLCEKYFKAEAKTITENYINNMFTKIIEQGGYK